MIVKYSCTGFFFSTRSGWFFNLPVVTDAAAPWSSSGSPPPRWTRRPWAAPPKSGRRGPPPTWRSAATQRSEGAKRRGKGLGCGAQKKSVRSVSQIWKHGRTSQFGVLFGHLFFSETLVWKKLMVFWSNANGKCFRQKLKKIKHLNLQRMIFKPLVLFLIEIERPSVFKLGVTTAATRRGSLVMSHLLVLSPSYCCTLMRSNWLRPVIFLQRKWRCSHVLAAKIYRGSNNTSCLGKFENII